MAGGLNLSSPSPCPTEEQLSPPADSANISWDTDLLSGADQPGQPATRHSDTTRDSSHDRSPPAPSPPGAERQDPGDPEDPEDSDGQPNPLVLPQARLTDYLSALDAAGGALGSRRGAQQAALVSRRYWGMDSVAMWFGITAC